MTKVLIATIYVFGPIIASATKVGAERLILLIDKEPDEKQQKSIDVIKQSLGAVLEIKTVATDIYDIVDVAKETVKIIDLLSDKDEIFVDITAGRKIKALGLLFGSYARINRVKKIMYVKEDKSIVSLPRLSYSLSPGQHKIVNHLLNHEVSSMSRFANKINLSQAMLYKHIRELKEMDIVEETKEGLKVTDYGEIVVL
ncbi:MAG: CRISPR-associated CARF protein Csa3 [Nanoarchaeota archaeon]|nr:CRISPR-associated CARF protein Csa3 [Nanoarchaeota archaeon]